MNYKQNIKNKGLSITYIANRLNINRATFSGYLNGISNMPLDVEVKLKQLLRRYDKE